MTFMLVAKEAAKNKQKFKEK